jgi:hypothetical protein
MIASPSQTPSNHPEPPSGPPFPPFRPDPAKLEQLLQSLLSPYASLSDVAANNDTTLAALTTWMAMPESQTLLDQVESAGYRRARMAGSNLLTDAVNSLSCALRGHVEIETRHYAQLDYFKIRIYERARVNARKAAWLLYRISRSHPALPIDPATQLKLEEARLERARLKAESRAESRAQLKHEPRADYKAQSAPESPPPSPSLRSTPSLRHSVTESLPPTDSLPSVALRDLRGEISPSSPSEPLDDLNTTLITCGISLDSS